MHQHTHTYKKVSGVVGYLGDKLDRFVKIATARDCVLISQLQLPLKPMETTHYALKHQTIQAVYGGSAHTYLRQNGSNKRDVDKTTDNP